MTSFYERSIRKHTTGAELHTVKYLSINGSLDFERLKGKKEMERRNPTNNRRLLFLNSILTKIDFVYELKVSEFISNVEYNIQINASKSIRKVIQKMIDDIHFLNKMNIMTTPLELKVTFLRNVMLTATLKKSLKFNI